VAAFVAYEQGARPAEEDIKAYCKDQMENHKIPAVILPAEEIPRTPTGKILKRELRERLKGQ
jgi:acyl-CoA synthetase (AMP-forming)/AMP-acid ligase II